MIYNRIIYSQHNRACSSSFIYAIFAIWWLHICLYGFWGAVLFVGRKYCNFGGWLSMRLALRIDEDLEILYYTSRLMDCKIMWQFYRNVRMFCLFVKVSWTSWIHHLYYLAILYCFYSFSLSYYRGSLISSHTSIRSDSPTYSNKMIDPGIGLLMWDIAEIWISIL